MQTKIDDMLAAWRERPPQTDLSQLEPRVWAAISGARSPQVAGLLSIRAAFVAAIIIGGVAAGAAAGDPRTEASPFSVHSPYAPSTLLEGKP
jgi:hypothetical protein